MNVKKILLDDEQMVLESTSCGFHLYAKRLSKIVAQS